MNISIEIYTQTRVSCSIFSKIFLTKYICPPKPIEINHRAALAIIYRKAMNILRRNNIKIYNKTLQNPFFLNFRWNISHNTHRKGCAMKFSQLKKHVPPP